MRYTYAYGYKTREAARDALEDEFAAGQVSQGEFPRIETYRNREGARRYRITAQA